MENITVEESIDLLSGKLKYQYRALAILSLFQFSCSSYILGLPFMLSRTSFSALGSFSKLENSESLISMVECTLCYIYLSFVGGIKGMDNNTWNGRMLIITVVKHDDDQ